MVDAATGEGSSAPDIDMGQAEAEVDLSGEGDVSLLPTLNIDQSDQAQVRTLIFGKATENAHIAT